MRSAAAYPMPSAIKNCGIHTSDARRPLRPNTIEFVLAMLSPIVSELVFPLLGTIIANMMWLAPMPELLAAKRRRQLGSLNPLPFLATLFNCIGWTIYSVQKRDYFIFWSNGTGTVLGCFYSLSALMLLARQDDLKSQDEKELCEGAFVFIIAFWAIMGMIAGIVYGPSVEQQTQATICVGIICDFAAISYFGAPLFTMFEVIKKKDASSLYAPQIFMNFVNATLWTSYGLFGTKDILLWLPNFLGMTLASLQLSFVFIFKKGSFFDALIGRTTQSSPSADKQLSTKYDHVVVNPLVVNPTQ